MKPHHFFHTLLISFVLFSASTFALRAADPDDLKAESEKLMERARDLKAEGRLEESEKTAAKAKQLAQQASQLADVKGEQPRQQTFIPAEELELSQDQLAGTELREQLRRKIEDLHRQGEHDKAQILERNLRQREGVNQPGIPPREAQEIQERLQHLEQAIGHLHAAGFHDPAHQLARQADRMRQELGRPREGMQNPMQPGMQNPMQPGMQNPMQPGMQNPMQPGMQNPMQPGMQNPMQPGMQNPMQPGMQNPMQPGRQNPMQPGRQNPMPFPPRAFEDLQSQVAELRGHVIELQRALDETRRFVKRHLPEDR